MQCRLPKTESSQRDIDLSTPLQNMLTEFARGRQPGEFLFTTRSGKPLEPSHVRKYIMLPNGIQGAHVLRRFRSTWCEEQGTPRSLLDAWIGHSNGNVTDRYIKSAEDLEFRRKQVERIGTGLNLAEALAPQIIEPGDPRPKKVSAAKSRAKKFRTHTPQQDCAHEDVATPAEPYTPVPDDLDPLVRVDAGDGVGGAVMGFFSDLFGSPKPLPTIHIRNLDGMVIFTAHWSSLEDRDLSNLVLRNADLRGIKMDYAVCRGTDFTGAKFVGSSLRGCDL